MNEGQHQHNFMGLALEEARKGVSTGNKPVGAVIVKDGAVIGRGHNTVVSGGDPTSHAEIEAIRDAYRENASGLSGTTLYSTMEPCPMCLWAIHITGIRRLVLGARHAAMGRSDLGDYAVERLMALTGQTIDLLTDVRRDECEEMRHRWEAEKTAP